MIKEQGFLKLRPLINLTWIEYQLSILYVGIQLIQYLKLCHSKDMGRYPRMYGLEIFVMAWSNWLLAEPCVPLDILSLWWKNISHIDVSSIASTGCSPQFSWKSDHWGPNRRRACVLCATHGWQLWCFVDMSYDAPPFLKGFDLILQCVCHGKSRYTLIWGPHGVYRWVPWQLNAHF